MPPRAWIIFGLMLAIAAPLGCRKKSGVAPPAAATQPSPIPPPTLTIDGRATSFGPARLQVWNEQGLCLLLTTPAGKTPGVASIYLRMPLDIDDLATLDGQRWDYKAGDLNRPDSPDGIFLADGGTLEPLDVTVKFAVRAEGDRQIVTMTIEGQFGLFATTDSDTVDRTVAVSGSVEALLPK